MPEVKVPELAESITEGTIAEWLKQVGDNVDKGEAIVELETDKVNVEVVSEEAGVLQELLANEGDTVEVGQSIAVVGEGSGNNASEAPAKQDDAKDDSSSEKAQPQQSETQNDKSEEKDQDNGQRVNATPSARKYAREKGIDLSEVAAQSNDVVRKEHVDQSQNQAS
ncbi:MAG: biotin/lipoyl-containing protein, partial [Staphylococcus equorum]